MVVVDNATGEVLARVASPDYFDERRAGQVDLTQAVRSPGSTLKPFIYGLGFEDGLIHPETLIEDRPIRYAGYRPENFDLTFQGTVTVRRALQLSLNVPAVAVLDQIGPSRLIARLGEAGASLVLPRSEAPGLALGLGGIGIRLTDLTMLYAGLARQGTVVPLIERAGCKSSAAAATDRTGRRLVGRQCSDRHAAAGERGRRAHRVQDRHELRLSRRMGDRLRRQANDRRVGRKARWRAGRRPRRPDGRCADPVRCLRAGRQFACSRCRRRRRARSSQPPQNCRRRFERFASPASTGEAMAPKVRIVFPPDGASLELSGSQGERQTRSPSRLQAARLPSTCSSTACRSTPGNRHGRCSSRPTVRASCG